MGLDKILSITGKPGLYELKAQTRGGFIAESLLDGKKISVNLRNNVSMLSEIAIYTITEEVPLREIFQKIKEKENSGPAINHKESTDKLTAYFEEILPDYDTDRVYMSDIKKVFQWYNLLQKKDLMDFSDPEKNEKETETDTEKSEKVKTEGKTEKPKKTTKATKAKKAEKTVDAKEKKLVEKMPAKGKKAETAKKAADKKKKSE